MFEFDKKKRRKHIVFGTLSSILLIVAALYFIVSEQYIHLIWVGLLLFWQIMIVHTARSIDCDYLSDDEDDDKIY